MNTIITQHKKYVLTALLLFITAASLQMGMPYLLSRTINEIPTSNYTDSLVLAITACYVSKCILQGAANAINSFTETAIRLSLIDYICKNIKKKSIHTKITLIKEDASRVAAAISNILQLSGSACITLFSCALITQKNLYFLPLLIIAATISFIYLRKTAPSIAIKYQSEISQEELYKLSILELINQTKPDKQFKQKQHNTFVQLEKAIDSQHLYQKNILKYAFAPEIFIASCMVVAIVFSASLSPTTFGGTLIYYVGYLGLFSMACCQSIASALSLVGIKQSIARIFDEDQQ